MSTSSSAGRSPASTSWLLFLRARSGDPSALDRLFGSCVAELRRWARGRLPRWARGAIDTADLVQDAVLRTLRRMETFDFRGRETLGAYLRTAVLNHIRDEHRRVQRRGVAEPLSEDITDAGPSVIDQTIGRQAHERYRAALARLEPGDRELVVAHVELDYSHEQLACMTGRSRNAARMALRRAIQRLAELMGDA
jgi:RNA polymerase sigma-70 factor, ECF subfamily